MKTTINAILMMGFVMVMALPAQAQSKDTTKPVKNNPKAANVNCPGTFVDKNNNGICDNYEARQTSGRGRNFVDKDGDGICDNRQNTGVKSSSASPNGRFCRQGKGNSNGNCCGRGHGYRHRFGGNPSSTGNAK